VIVALIEYRRNCAINTFSLHQCAQITVCIQLCNYVLNLNLDVPFVNSNYSFSRVRISYTLRPLSVHNRLSIHSRAAYSKEVLFSAGVTNLSNSTKYIRRKVAFCSLLGKNVAEKRIDFEEV